MNNPNMLKTNYDAQGGRLWDVFLVPLFLVLCAFGALAFMDKLI